MTKFTTVEQVWKAIDEGKTVYWASKAYALTIEDSNLEWRKQVNMAVPFSNRNGKCLRATCLENWFGSLISENDLGRLFVEEDVASFVDVDPFPVNFGERA